jgi:oligopeptidase B
VEDVEGFRGFLAVVEREKGLKRLRIFDAAGTAHAVEFNEPVYAFSLTRNPEYDTPEIRFSYTSLVTPSSVYDYNTSTKTRALRKQQEVLGGYDPSQYAMERLSAKAADGAAIPISLVYRKGMKRDGSNPLLLYGYGSYGATSEPMFSSDRLSLLDRGFIYTIAHIRGGSDVSRYWYEDGKLLKKKNTFRDFIVCAERLIELKYTSPRKLAISGAGC